MYQFLILLPFPLLSAYSFVLLALEDTDVKIEYVNGCELLDAVSFAFLSLAPQHAGT